MPSKTKTKKDPNAPKRYHTAYQLWSHDQREQLRLENPNWDPIMLREEISDRWKTLDDKTFQQYKTLSDLEKVQYEDQLEAYKEANRTKHSSTDDQSPIAKKIKKK